MIHPAESASAKSVVAVLGAGSWGTAIAIHLASQHHQVLLWGRNLDYINEIATHHENRQYLPGITLPANLIPTYDLQQCVADEYIIAVPSHSFGEVLTAMPKPKSGIAWLTKGLDPTNSQFLSQIVSSQFGNTFPIAIISGPSFAKEVAQHLPTALTIAGNSPTYLKTIQSLLHNENMRAYLTDDTIGVQLCGAVKNVLAIACGISDGLNFGANARAALITRGLAEMRRLGTKLGAKSKTFMGLAGVGDLVLTCTDNQSRNRRFGLLLGQGVTPAIALQQIGQVVEGKDNAQQVCLLAQQQQINMPICEAVNALLKGVTTPAEAVTELMRRPPRKE